MAFKMRSGNAPKFRKMGSSPIKEDINPLDSGELYTRLRNQERINDALAEQLRGSKKEVTTRNERILRGEGSKKDRAIQALDWEKRQAYLNEMAWNSKNYTGDYAADRWSGSKIKDLRFSFKDAIMGGDLTSGFSAPEGSSSNVRKSKKKKEKKYNTTACPVFKKDKDGNIKGGVCIAPQ